MRGRMAMLGLYVRQGAPWFAELRAELLNFPAGRHDDQVDALGLVSQLLEKINAGQKPKPPENSPGTMTVAGNLAFQSGALFLVQVNPSTASTANVTAGGSATLAGTKAMPGMDNSPSFRQF
jgi:hypothetical protein